MTAPSIVITARGSHAPDVGGLTTWRWGLCIAGVFAVACLIATVNNGHNLPLDTHDALVARSAEEMLARHDLLVPYFNDTPRLKKPPLMYWLVIGVHQLVGGAEPIISPFEARLPSAVAGVALVMVVLGFAAARFGRPVGLVAGLITATTLGFTTSTHAARPEMVYALFCTAGLFCFLLAEQDLDAAARLHTGGDGASGGANGAARWWPLAGWASWGLAMLTKGPQLVGLMLLGLIISLALTGGWRRVVAVLRPAGVVIFLCIGLGWYAAVVATHSDAMRIWRTELGSKTQGGNATLREWLLPYYLVNGPKLALPWVMLVPLAALTPWFGRLRRESAVKHLWWAVLLSFIALQLIPVRRDYYALPLLGPLAVLMAIAALEINRSLREAGRGWLCGVALATHAAALAVGIVIVRTSAEYRLVPPWAVALVIAIALAALAVSLAGIRAGASAGLALAGLLITLVVGGALFFAISLNGSLWGSNRYARAQFAEAIARTVPAADKLEGWTPRAQNTDDQQAWVLEQCYSHRVVHVLNDPAAITSLASKPNGGWLLVDRDVPPTLPSGVTSEVALTSRVDHLELWHVRME